MNNQPGKEVVLYEIADDVPVPDAHRSRGERCTDKLRAMTVGQSTVIPAGSLSLLTRVRKETGRDFTSRRIADTAANGAKLARVWRLG